MGGDDGCPMVVAGVERFASARSDVKFLLHGDEAQLTTALENAPAARARSEIRHTEKCISMDAKPAQAVRRGKGSSMWNAIDAVKKGEASAAVSAGNTGVLMGHVQVHSEDGRRRTSAGIMPRAGRHLKE